mmetsp:Transcript_9820/g.16141  ORF Transcript_9820/g.16141 Transcript_9820/m.16141 type:complete len:201 (-) Transcript_9820:6-608(-)
MTSVLLRFFAGSLFFFLCLHTVAAFSTPFDSMFCTGKADGWYAFCGFTGIYHHCLHGSSVGGLQICPKSRPFVVCGYSLVASSICSKEFYAKANCIQKCSLSSFSLGNILGLSSPTPRPLLRGVTRSVRQEDPAKFVLSDFSTLLAEEGSEMLTGHGDGLYAEESALAAQEQDTETWSPEWHRDPVPENQSPEKTLESNQ